MCGLNKTNFHYQDFYSEICDIVKNIPAGRVITYGQIARLAGFPHHSRLVGHVLSKIPSSLHLPCHRVVNSQGRTVAHWPGQQKLLEQEGVKFKSNGCVNLKQYQWSLF